MKIALLGFDREGRASYDYFVGQGGHDIEIRDQNPDIDVPAAATSVLGQGYLDDLDKFDLVVRTAGLPPHLILDKNPDVSAKLTTHINEFFKALPTRRIIGVTGTKGKGTTSTLIAKMLEAAGHDVRLGGNIGVPPLTFLPDLTADSWVVLELSSFQLIDIQAAPHIAVCLMVVPEHLDWHADLGEYETAKAQLFKNQSVEDIAIYFAESPVSKKIAEYSPGRKLPYYATPGAEIRQDKVMIGDIEICHTSDIKLLGRHNWQNICAAVTAVWQAGMHDAGAIASVLTSFRGLEHRLEFVRELEGVRYYDDSFGTTPETAIVAMQAFEQPKVIILGGSDKGASYEQLAHTVLASNVRAVVLIGDQAKRIQDSLEGAGFTSFRPGGDSMTQIVDTARSLAQPGDIVLLSTACASFDMFQNYKDRGQQFTETVQALA